MFAAMAAFLVAALCVPGAFGSEALLFACAYAAVRAAHIALFMLASREDASLRHSVLGLACSSTRDRRRPAARSRRSQTARVQLGLWALALLLDIGGPFLFGIDGWKLVPGHFAERHGAIVIIALGESIVAIGVGAKADDRRRRRDRRGARGRDRRRPVVGLLRRRRDHRCPSPGARARGRERNEIARDSYSYLHFPMVAGIALIAVGIKRALDRGRRPAEAGAGRRAARRRGDVPARACRVQAAQHAHAQRTSSGVRGGPARAGARSRDAACARDASAILAAVLVALIAYEALRYAEVRDRVRHQPVGGGVSS